MGIGRMAFIHEFGLVPSVMARVPKPQAMISGDLYLDWKAGLAFSKPEGWNFDTLADRRRTFGGILVNSQEGGESIPIGDWIDPDEFQPIFIASKTTVGREIVGAHGPDDRTLAPILCISQEGDHEEVYPPLSLLDQAESDLTCYQELYRCFSVVSAPRVGTLSGCEAVEFTSTYLFGHQNLPEWIPTRERVVYVAQDSSLYGIHMYDYPAVSPDLIQDYDPILTAFRFA